MVLSIRYVILKLHQLHAIYQEFDTINHVLYQIDPVEPLFLVIEGFPIGDPHLFDESCLACLSRAEEEEVVERIL